MIITLIKFQVLKSDQLFLINHLIFIKKKHMFSCKTLRRCYQEMLNDLLDMDEVPCVEDAAIGLSTVSTFSLNNF